MNRGDVYWVNLDPTVGADIKTVPRLIVGATPINRGCLAVRGCDSHVYGNV